MQEEDSFSDAAASPLLNDVHGLNPLSVVIVGSSGSGPASFAKCLGHSLKSWASDSGSWRTSTHSPGSILDLSSQTGRETTLCIPNAYKGRDVHLLVSGDEGLHPRLAISADGYFLLFSCLDRRSLAFTKTQHARLQEFGVSHLPRVLVATQCDAASSARTVSHNAGADLAANWSCPFVETSTDDCHGALRALVDLLDNATAAPQAGLLRTSSLHSMAAPSQSASNACATCNAALKRCCKGSLRCLGFIVADSDENDAGPADGPGFESAAGSNLLSVEHRNPGHHLEVGHRASLGQWDVHPASASTIGNGKDDAGLRRIYGRAGSEVNSLTPLGELKATGQRRGSGAVGTGTRSSSAAGLQYWSGGSHRYYEGGDRYNRGSSGSLVGLPIDSPLQLNPSAEASTTAVHSRGPSLQQPLQLHVRHPQDAPSGHGSQPRGSGASLSVLASGSGSNLASPLQEQQSGGRSNREHQKPRRRSSLSQTVAIGFEKVAGAISGMLSPHPPAHGGSAAQQLGQSLVAGTKATQTGSAVLSPSLRGIGRAGGLTATNFPGLGLGRLTGVGVLPPGSTAAPSPADVTAASASLRQQPSVHQRVEVQQRAPMPQWQHQGAASGDAPRIALSSAVHLHMPLTTSAVSTPTPAPFARALATEAMMKRNSIGSIPAALTMDMGVVTRHGARATGMPMGASDANNASSSTLGTVQTIPLETLFAGPRVGSAGIGVGSFISTPSSSAGFGSQSQSLRPPHTLPDQRAVSFSPSQYQLRLDLPQQQQHLRIRPPQDDAQVQQQSQYAQLIESFVPPSSTSSYEVDRSSGTHPGVHVRVVAPALDHHQLLPSHGRGGLLHAEQQQQRAQPAVSTAPALDVDQERGRSPAATSCRDALEVSAAPAASPSSSADPAHAAAAIVPASRHRVYAGLPMEQPLRTAGDVHP